MLRATFFESKHKIAWDSFLKDSQCPLFFFYRDFMAYHHDRFTDASTLLWEDQRLIGIVPASVKSETLVSHGGLTYGGILLNSQRHSKLQEALKAFAHLWLSKGLTSFVLKKPPFFFSQSESQDDIFELWRAGATLIKRDLTTFVDLEDFNYSKGRKSSVKKGKMLGVEIDRGTTNLQEFYLLLESVLHNGHGVKPTHSENEIALLMERFPQHIQLKSARWKDKMAAAALVFHFGDVIHTQYLCASHEGREACALDVLIDSLLNENKGQKKFLSFGISTEDGGKTLNDGLLLQKESFGGKNCCIDTYQVEIKNLLK